MVKFYTLRKRSVIALLMLIISSVHLCYGQDSEVKEDFSTAPNTGSSYVSGTFTGSSSLEWNYNSSRFDQTINGKAYCSGKSSSSYLETTGIAGGVGTLKFKYKKAFSKNSVLTILINDESVATIQVNSNDVTNFEQQFNVGGEFDLKFSTTERVVIDDIDWTSYDDGTPTTPKVSLSVSSSETSESAAETIKVRATLSETRAEATTVSLNVQGTDITTSDYQLSATQITIPAGDEFAEVDLQILNDSDEENTEDLSLTITSETTGVEIKNGTQVVSVLDDERIANDGTEALPYTIEEAIALSKSSTKYFAVGYIVGVGKDFTAPFSNERYVSVADSPDDTDHSRCLHLKFGSTPKPIWNLVSHPENVGKQIKFNGYRDDYYGHQSFEGNTTVEEIGALPKVTLSASATSGKEVDQTEITFTATLNSAVDASQTVDVAIAGTGITSTDYTLSATQLTFASGETVKTFTVTIADDSEDEGNETMTVSLQNPSAGIQLGNVATKNITVVDNGVELNDGSEALPFTIAEAVALPETSTEYYAVGYIVGVLEQFSGTFSNQYVVTLADSRDETDYSNCMNLQLQAGTIRDTWNLADNPDNLGAQIKFNGYRKDYYGHAAFKGNSSVVELNGLPRVNLSASATSGTEADQTVITFTATLDKASDANQTVDVAIAGTGIAATDYTLSAAQITFAATETSKTFTVTVADDTDDEGDENMTVSLQNPSAGIKLGTTVQQSVSLIDNDNIRTTVQFDSGSITKNEDAGTIQIPLNLVNPSTNETQVSISLGETTDISSYSQTVTFGASQTTANLTVAINDDNEEEANEQFTFTITAVSGGTQAKLGTQTTCTLAIIDNDGSITGILANYVYIDPQTNSDGSIIVGQTPKEYVATATPSHHMKSVLIPENYYQSAVGYSGSDLRNLLQTIISTNAQAKSYTYVWTMCKEADENPKNSDEVWLIYTEQGRSKTKQDRGSGNDVWNREHVWAKSHGGFGTSAGAGTDGHHLRAADKTENSTRNNRDFGNASPGYTPPKSARGDVARMIFYMAVRYGFTVDNLCKQSETAARHGKLDDLLEWHEEDPVDPYEVRRNNKIFGHQLNRNPFVDHPELVQYVFGEAKAQAWTGGVGAAPLKLRISGSLSDFGLIKFGTESEEQTFAVSGQDLSANVSITAPEHFQIATQSGNFTSSLELPVSNGSLAETTIRVKFVPTSAVRDVVSAQIAITSGDESRNLSVSGTEGDPALLPTDIYTDNFNSNSGDWVMHSVSSNKDWHYSTSSDRVEGRDGTVGMAMNNYGADGNSEDWLISPELQLSTIENPEIHFWMNSKYSGSTVELLYSTDYSGSGDPSTATWTSIESLSSLPTSYTEKTINLSVTQNIYFAFKHTSGNGSGQTAAICIDDFVVKGVLKQGKSTQTISFSQVRAKVYGAADFTLEATSTSGLPVTFALISGPATINNNMVSIIGVGNIVVEARQAGNDSYEAATAVSQTITVAKASQAISFAQVAAKVYGDADFALAATSTSGLPVAYNLISGPASLNGSTITIEGAGQIVVEAIQAGNSLYQSATTVSQTITVAKAEQTITFTGFANIYYGMDDFRLSASTNSNLPVLFEVVSGPASVSGKTISLEGAGEVIVRASQEGNDNYRAAEPVTQVISVAKTPQTITFAELEDKVFGDEAFELNASSSLGLQVHFELKSGAAHMDGNMLNIDGAGQVVVVASQEGDENCAAAKVIERTFMVQKADQTINIQAITDNVLVGDTITFDATVSSDLALVYEIMEGTGTMSGDTLITEAAGDFVVKVYQAGNENYNSTETLVNFTVGQTTGVDNLFVEQMKMYPNPASDFVNMSFPTYDEKEVVIMNNAGEVVKQLTVGKNARINLGELSPGLYIVRIKKDETILNKKLMIAQ